MPGCHRLNVQIVYALRRCWNTAQRQRQRAYQESIHRLSP
jgi:hypothetical protein